jgi:hypothetical protein
MRYLSHHAILLATTILGASVCWGSTITSTVQGTADIYLAGQPSGSTLSGDSAPTNSPVFASGLTLIAGQSLTISATGSAGGFGCTTTNPDGSGCGSFTMGPSNNLSSATLLAGALVGTFITNVPPPGPAPAGIDWTGANGTAATISPALWQVFFIGDGLTGTGSGSAQSFVIPTGATRLFLGVADSAGANFNNTGSYSVTINDNQVASGVPEPATWMTMILVVGIIAFSRKLRRI